MSRERQGVYGRPPSEQVRNEQLGSITGDSELRQGGRAYRVLTKLVDIHIYLVSAEQWRDHSRSAVSQVIGEAASAGFIRVLPELSLYATREEIEAQLGEDLPRDFVFLRSVGRHLARVRPRQEFQLKVKSFLPPHTYAPELFLVETTPEMRASFPYSEASSRSDSNIRDRLEPMHTGETTKSDTSIFNDRRPIPPIRLSVSTISLATQTGEADRSPRKDHSYPPPVEVNSGSVAPPYDAPQTHAFHQHQPPAVVGAPSRVNSMEMASQTGDNVDYERPTELNAPSRTVSTNNHISTQTDNPSALVQQQDFQFASTENVRFMPEDNRNVQPFTSGHQNGVDPRGNMGDDRGYAQRQGECLPQWQGRLDMNDHTQWHNPNSASQKTNSATTPNLYASSTFAASNDSLQTQPNFAVRSNTFPSKMDRACQTVITGQEHKHDLDTTRQNGFPANQSFVASGERSGYPSSGSANPRNPNVLPPFSRNPTQFHHTDPGRFDPNFPPPHQEQPQQYTGQFRGNPTIEYPDGIPPGHSHQGHDQLAQGVEYNTHTNTGHYDYARNAHEVPEPLDTDMVGSKTPAPQPGKYAIDVSEDSGISDGLTESERRQQEYIRKQQSDREPLSQRWDSEGLPTGEAVPWSGTGDQEGYGWLPNGSRRMPPGSARVEGNHSGREEVNHSGHGPSGRIPSARPGSGNETWQQRNQLPTDDPYKGIPPHSEDEPRSNGLDVRNDREREEVGGRRSGSDDTAGDGRTEPSMLLRVPSEADDEQVNRGRSNLGSRPDGQLRDPSSQSLPVTQDNQKERERLEAELEQARTQRAQVQRRREELVRRAKSLQEKSKKIRNHSRDVWKKTYFDEKKKTLPLEDEAQRMQQELETLHKRFMSHLETDTKDTGKKKEQKNTQKTSLQIQATKVQHQTEDLRGRIEKVKLRLTSEMKLRNQAETELRVLKAELTQKKIHVTLSRMQPGPVVNSSSSTALALPPS